MKEFEVYVPLRYNDGSPVEKEVIDSVGDRLLDAFGGYTFFPQQNQGYWRMGGVTYQDEIVIFRVLTAEVRRARRFYRKLKEELKRELRQEEILIVIKTAETM